MNQTLYGEIVLSQDDICDVIMQGRDLADLTRAMVDPEINTQALAAVIDDPDVIMSWTKPDESGVSIDEFDRTQQSRWHMPKQYVDFDIAEHVLSLCSTQEQLQRVGEELLLFQERGLFDLLRYLKYLVDTMRDHGMIWGVGRGSSVASYVLYLMGVHRIDSMFYDLDPREFLR